MAFAQNLKHLMDCENMTNYQLAKKLGCHQTTVQNWLDGSTPQKRTQRSIADEFGISVSELMGDALPQPNRKETPAPISESEPLSLDYLRTLSTDELLQIMKDATQALSEKK